MAEAPWTSRRAGHAGAVSGLQGDLERLARVRAGNEGFQLAFAVAIAFPAIGLLASIALRAAARPR